MRVLRPNKNIEWAGRYNLQPGVCYVFTGRQAIDIERMAIARYGADSCTLDPARLEWSYKEWEGQDLTGKTLLLWRTGGLGDLVALHVAIQEAKRRWPTCKIIFACDDNYAGMFDGDSFIDELRPYPIRLDWLQESDYHLCFEALVEENEDAKHLHFVDLFLNKCGLRGVEKVHKIPELPCVARAVQDTDVLFEKHQFAPEDFTVGIQYIVDAPIRRYPPAYLATVGKELIEAHNAKIVWLGSRHQIDEIDQTAIARYGLEKNSINLPSKLRTWQHTAAAVAKCDLLISADSGTIHVAGANKTIIGERVDSPYSFGFREELGWTHTPQVGIYGPFHARQRQAYYRHALGIDSDVICAGCNQHGYASCRRGFPSPCLEVIKLSYVGTTSLRWVIVTNALRKNPKKIANVDISPEEALALIQTEERKERFEFLPAPNGLDALVRGEF